MRIDRAEQAGFGVALAAHVLLVAILSMGFFAIRTPLPVKRPAIEVQLVDEVGLESGAPQISETPPAPKLAEVEGPIEPPPAPAPTAQPPKATAPAPAPKPAVKPAPPAPQPKAAAKPPVRTAGRLKGLLTGVSDQDSDSRSRTAPAATITPAVQSSLAAEIRRQLKPHWQPPTGADVDQLRTVLRINLARDGSVTNVTVVGTTGINASNRAQSDLHQERAVKAVRLASPFQLPAQFYDGWKSMTVNFDLRLSL
ncbi:MAG TPA: TonB C-terminal domain-containing protein [Allosphingosinicella sp.]|nr:TonB C-terminal domain-containing protein [Allosphingosinicella sp.]